MRQYERDGRGDEPDHGRTLQGSAGTGAAFEPEPAGSANHPAEHAGDDVCPERGEWDVDARHGVEKQERVDRGGPRKQDAKEEITPVACVVERLAQRAWADDRRR